MHLPKRVPITRWASAFLLSYASTIWKRTTGCTLTIKFKAMTTHFTRKTDQYVKMFKAWSKIRTSVYQRYDLWLYKVDHEESEISLFSLFITHGFQGIQQLLVINVNFVIRFVISLLQKCLYNFIVYASFYNFIVVFCLIHNGKWSSCTT